MITKVIHAGHRALRQLGTYVMDPEKTGLHVSANVVSLDLAIPHMLAVAAANTRCKKPFYHIAIGWHPNDNPSATQMREIALGAMRCLGLEEHQWIASSHIDAGHPHMHIVANRVHPRTFRAASTSNDYRKLGQFAARVELQFGWTAVGRYPSSSELFRLGDKTVSERHLMPRNISPAATRGSGSGGRISFQEYISGKPRAALLKAVAAPDASWPKVHCTLARYGLLYEVTSRGGLLIDASDARFGAGASRMARFASLPKLEALLGPYEPCFGLTSAGTGYSASFASAGEKALRPTSLLAKYNERTAALRAENAQIRKKMWNTQNREERFKRKLIYKKRKELLRRARLEPPTDRARLRAEAHAQCRRDLEELKYTCRRKRERLKADLKRELPRVESWMQFVRRLAVDGDPDAQGFLADQRLVKALRRTLGNRALREDRMSKVTRTGAVRVPMASLEQVRIAALSLPPANKIGSAKSDLVVLKPPVNAVVGKARIKLRNALHGL